MSNTQTVTKTKTAHGRKRRTKKKRKQKNVTFVPFRPPKSKAKPQSERGEKDRKLSVTRRNNTKYNQNTRHFSAGRGAGDAMLNRSRVKKALKLAIDRILDEEGLRDSIKKKPGVVYKWSSTPGFINAVVAGMSYQGLKRMRTGALLLNHSKRKQYSLEDHELLLKLEEEN
jgi:hypothetical protein